MTDCDYSKFTIIPNAIDLNLFTNVKEPEQRDNRILWCSNPDRGLNIILKYLYDDIKKEILYFKRQLKKNDLLINYNQKVTDDIMGLLYNK